MTDTNFDVVTVVVTCFNYGEFLPDALASLKSQEGGPPQIIVVDDGSTEAQTHRVLEDIDSDPAIQLVRQANAGLPAARNAGIAQATTPLLVMLDADDMLTPRTLSVLRAALDAHPEAGYAYGQIQFFGDWGGLMHMPPFDPWRLLFRHIVGPTALMRRELIDVTGGYDPAYSDYEDWEIWLHALAHGLSGVKVETPTHLYRRHGVTMNFGNRARFRETSKRMRQKHASLYDNLGDVAKRSSVGLRERLVYRWIWGERPWPAAVELAAYSVLFRSMRVVGAARSITTTVR